MASLDPKYRGGRPHRIPREQRRAAVAVAGARPDHQAVALTRWSLPRLADHLRASGVLQISPAHLGRLLAHAGLSFQRTRTWKASPDPDYAPKAARVLELTSAPPADGGVVIAFDQMGPISLRPTAGAGWAPQGRPERQRATYHRTHGTRYIFGAYDVHHDRLRVRLRPRRRGSDNLAFMAQIRAAIPARRRIYWFQDGLRANWTPDIRAFAHNHKTELVPTPTYASYLNPVECQYFRSPSSWSTTPTTSTGTPSPRRSPATSNTATGHTATNASVNSKPATGSPPDAITRQTFRERPLEGVGRAIQRLPSPDRAPPPTTPG
jgi:hypothetical protein